MILEAKKHGPVLVDPGHGGPDAGARGPRGLLEKDVNLLVAREIAAHLDATGWPALLTREGDEERSAVQRTEMAASVGASVLVSIHVNASIRPGMRGTEAYHRAGCPESARLADVILKRVTAACGLPNRGRKAGTFAVLRRSPVPAALIELVFISDPDEEAMLGREEFRKAAAAAVAEGIREYLGDESARTG